jgi:hypothetical protein
MSRAARACQAMSVTTRIFHVGFTRMTRKDKFPRSMSESSDTQKGLIEFRALVRLCGLAAYFVARPQCLSRLLRREQIQECLRRTR